jgi:hypothetical protein
MVESTDEHRSRRYRARIRGILMQEWDPIGVRNIPGAPEREYDMYIDGVCALLADRKPAQQQRITEYLLDIQSRRMQLRVSDAAQERCDRAAQALIATRTEFDP